ncbi:hypothetical protein BASA50_005563 [Batrachochytrium salamandrivorans]|uniref:Enoyl reductase (ER) domain-containing protein n=1 Tax=Batrachochytrium salamandrivorans TaxID=1357716 RepID=A0ABQ8FCF8_9FUNG|nr:hypothetical protein BASA50_005563 [Batrachochytrium salamandrivorans]
MEGGSMKAAKSEYAIHYLSIPGRAVKVHISSMTSHTNTQVLFKQDPGAAHVQTSHMEVVHTPFQIPTTLAPGELVVKNLMMSLDPYMRSRMNTTNVSYFDPFTVGKVLTAGGVSQVIAGSRGNIKVGDVVSTFVGWELYTVLSPETLARKVDTSLSVPLSYHLGILGMVGATAYHGLLNLCTPKAGETLFVSGAAGAVGLVVGQIAKIKGLRVIGSAGSDDKVRLLKEKYGFDAAFNYKTVPSITKELALAAPKGVDVYFDNVGGEHLDAALSVMNTFGRIAACGMISQYNGQSYTYKNLPLIIGKQLRMEGFIISTMMAKPEFMIAFAKDMAEWFKQGKLTYTEHTVSGIENAPDAFVGLFRGDNTGKLVVNLSDPVSNLSNPTPVGLKSSI